MRSERLTIVATLRALGPRGLAARLVEMTGWLLVIGLLEAVGELLPPSDVVALGVLTLGIGPLAVLALTLARRGRLPLATLAAGSLLAAGRRLVARLTPRFEFAFRLGPTLRVHRDGTLLGWVAALAVALVAALLLAGEVFDGLALLRARVAFTLEMLSLAVLWSALLLVLTLGFALEAQRLGVPLAALMWVSGLAAAAILPAVAFVGAILLLGLVQDLRLRGRVLAPYLFCRRTPAGEVRAVRAQAVLLRVHLLAPLGVALVVTLSNAERLFRPGLIQGAYAFTAGLGVLVAVPALLLVARIGQHFGRLFCLGGETPESPLVPTLWWTGRLPAPAAAAEVLGDGWALLTGPRQPSDAFDLVAPLSGCANSLRLDPEAAPPDRAFARRRRFHVVHRRTALRRLQTLVKATRRQAGRRGTGFLFCPHTWLVPNLLRDAGRTAVPVGPAFEGVFPSRTRRYLGQLLRALGVDLVFWEDAVTWSDLKRVWGVAFECYDQGRLPLEERHFVGLPRLRVLLQAEDGPGAGPEPRRPGLPSMPVGTGARVLVILRDRGGEPVRDEAASPSDRRPLPQPA